MVRRGFRTIAIVAAMSMMLNPSYTVLAKTGRTATVGTWKTEGSKWTFLDNAGNKLNGWIVYNGDWYYLLPQDGTLKTGWLTQNGKSYFLSTESGQFTGRLLSGWQWIDGYCYYFIAEDSARYGELFTGGTTPDGYTVDSAGRWTKDGTAVYENGKGLSSSENAQQVAGADRPIPSGGTGSFGGRSSGSGRGGRQGGGSTGTAQNGSQGNQKEDSGNKGGSTKEDDTKKEEQENSKTASLVATAQTKLVHTELGNFLSLAFLEGTKEDYTVTVDGTDISSALTNVDDSGQIAKWRATVAHPKKLVISRKSDGKTEEIKLEEGKAAAEESKVEVMAGNPQDHPKYLLAQGTATVFDRLLPNNGKDGKERFTPKKSTFTLFEKKKEDPDAIQAEFYVKPVVIDAEGNGVGGKGIKAEFSLGTDKEKDWFNGIDQISLLRYEDNTVLNRNLSFKKTDPVSGKHGFVGTLQVPVGQDNMRSRGLYILAIHSKKTEEVITLPIELQSNTRFQVDIAQETMAPKTGERVKFRINGENGESFGNEIKVDDMQVTLEKPSGKKEKLSYIDDYFNFGGNFILYGTSSNKEKTVNTDEAGMYTIKIKYSGYPTLSKQFIVYKGEGQNTEDKQEDAARSNARAAHSGKKADAVSAATSGKTSTHAGKKESGKKGKESVYDGVSSATGTVNTRVNVVFDYDLLENALVLNEIKALNEDARNVLVWYYGMNFDRFGYLFDEGAKNYYSVEKYMNALKSDETKGGKIRSYSAYRKEAEAADFNGVSEVQFVLEDGTLGSLSDFKKYKGEDTPSFSGTTIKKGEDIVLHTDNTKYLSKIQGVYTDGSSENQMSYKYPKRVTIDKEKGTITLHRYAFNFLNPATPEVGKHTITLDAGADYKKVDITLTITQEEITEKPTLVGEAAVGKDLTLSLPRNAILRFAGVSLQKGNGEVKTLLDASAGGTSGNDYYVLDKENDQLIIKAGRFKEAGEYTVYVKVKEQNGTLNTTFQVKEKSDTPEEPKEEEDKGLEAPEVKYFKEERKEPRKRNILSFVPEKTSPTVEITDYLEKVNRVVVNGVEYQKVYFHSVVDRTEDSYALYFNNGSGNYSNICLSPSAFVEGENVIEVYADGYKKLQYKVTLKGKEEADSLAVPEGASLEYVSLDGSYQVGFGGEHSTEISKYLKNITSVSVNGVSYEKTKISQLQWLSGRYALMDSDGGDKDVNGIALSAPSNGANKIKVVVKAKGYEDLSLTYPNSAE
nr:cell wall-binding protein [uncultured Oribacterium sp.]